jgi:hypothetical protein
MAVALAHHSFFVHNQNGPRESRAKSARPFDSGRATPSSFILPDSQLLSDGRLDIA